MVSLNPVSALLFFCLDPCAMMKPLGTSKPPTRTINRNCYYIENMHCREGDSMIQFRNQDENTNLAFIND